MSSSIQERLLEDMKKAQKDRNTIRLNAIRWIRDAVQKTAKERKIELADEEIVQVLTSLAKKYRDSIEQAGAAGRAEFVEKEKTELAILEEYLPKQLSQAEIEKLVSDAIASAQAKGPKDMGLVMKTIKPAVAGKADGKLVSEIVKSKLAALS